MKKHLTVLTALALVTAACSGSSSSEPEVTAPPPATSGPGSTATGSTAPPTTETTPSSEAPETSPSTEPSAPSTEPPEATTSTAVGGEAFLPDDLGPRVESVAGVNAAGEIVELSEMVWLFVPSEPDESDANVVVPLPEDVEIIAAYGRAMSALYGQVTMSPIPAEPTDSMEAAFLDGGEKYSENVFASRNAAGEHLGFPDGGDVLRPVVLADPRSDDEAFIFDCAISRSKYLNAEGSLAAGETGGEVLAPMIIRLVRTDNGEWIVDDIQDDERACA